MIPQMIQPLFHIFLWIHMAISPIHTVMPVGYGSVLDVLKENHTVTTGFVCNSPLDIVCIDSLCNDDKHVWTIEVNDDYTNYNSTSKIMETDRVELIYGKRKVD